MGWHDLLFLHWRVPAELLQAQLPPGVALETFDGSAWLGVVPFRMVDTRFRWLPRMPTAHTFPELNLRTYVRVGERRGVWFFSLDAASRLAVEGARFGFGLPYLTARMQCERDGDAIRYRSERTDRRGPPATFVGSWRPAGPFAPGPVVQRPVLQPDLPLEREQPGHGLEQGRLAGAVGADDAGPAAGRQVQIDALQHRAAAQADGQAAHRQRGAHRPPPTRRRCMSHSR